MPLTRRSVLAGLAATACAPRAASPDRSAAADAVLDAWEPQPRPLPDGFLRGMNLAHLHRRGYGYGSDRAAAQLAHLAAMGVRDIALNPFAYTRSLTTPTISWGGDPTLTDDDLRRQVEQARALGLRVCMKPHLWSWQYMAGKGNMDITLARDEWPEWFARYTEYAVHFARLAAETGCEGFCVGLEYTGATRANPGAWAKVARACRQVFPGRLTYAANWYEEWEIFADWEAFDVVSVDAYFPLAARTTSVDALVAAWQPHLDAMERALRGRPVVFAEAGYRAVAGATDKPWEEPDGAPDPGLQARGYEALLRACTARPWFAGVYWWKWFTDVPGEADAFLPAGNPAERVIAAWFGG